jgi:hypothetical protein
MPKTSPAPGLTVHGPTGLVAAVPAMLGFHPSESLVLICIRQPGLVGPVARADLEDERETAPTSAMARQLASYAVQYAEIAALVCYTDRPGRPSLLDATANALDAASVPLLDVLTVRDGIIRRGRTAEIEDADRGMPAPSDDDPQVEALASLNACHGRGVLPHREALRGSIAAPSGRALADARAAIIGVCENLARMAEERPGEDLTQALVSRASRALTRARRELRDSGRVASATAAELIVMSHSIPVRDTLIARAVSERDEVWVPTLISVVTRCPAEEAAEICAMLAVVAYRYGDGALSQVAIDRVLATEPRHRLAHLLLSATASGIRPDDLAELAGTGRARRQSARRRTKRMP